MSTITMMQFRNDSNTTDDSPFGSALNTPADEETVMNFDKLGERLLHEYSGPGVKLEQNKKESFLCDTSISIIHLADISKPSVATISDEKSSMALTNELPSLENDQASPALDSPNMDHLSVGYDLPSFATPTMEPNSPAIASSPEIEFNHHQRASSLYSIPNVPICISPAISHANLLSQSTSSSNSLDGLMLNIKRPETELPESESVESYQTKPKTISTRSREPQDSRKTLIDASLLLLPAQVLCFVPWCIAVGCALVLFPKHLEEVLFSSGYYYSPSTFSPRGIRRFAHLAEFALPHVGSFLAFLIVTTWYNMPLGLALSVLAFGQAFVSWQDFQEDVNVPLGEDDRMSVYWVLKRYAAGESCFGLREEKGGYFVTYGSGASEVEEDDE